MDSKKKRFFTLLIQKRFDNEFSHYIGGWKSFIIEKDIGVMPDESKGSIPAFHFHITDPKKWILAKLKYNL
jgi:hypothetical protein